MLKTTITRSPHRSAYDVAAATDTQRVMIVNGCLGILELIETIRRHVSVKHAPKPAH